MIAFASSLDQAGPFTRDVTDAALLFASMVGEDPYDSTSLAFPEPIGLPSATDLRGIRLGVPSELTGEGIEPGVLATFDETIAIAKDLGAEIVDITLPHAPHALAAYYLIAPAEASANLSTSPCPTSTASRSAARSATWSRATLRHRGQRPRAELDRLVGLEVGADDYLVKPFSMCLSSRPGSPPSSAVPATAIRPDVAAAGSRSPRSTRPTSQPRGHEDLTPVDTAGARPRRSG